MHVHNLCIFRWVVEDDHGAVVGPEEGDVPHPAALLLVNPDAHRAGREELREVAHGVVGRLLDELVLLGVDEDGRVHVVAGPGGAALHVEHQGPLHPTRHPVVEIV